MVATAGDAPGLKGILKHRIVSTGAESRWGNSSLAAPFDAVHVNSTAGRYYGRGDANNRRGSSSRGRKVMNGGGVELHIPSEVRSVLRSTYPGDWQELPETSGEAHDPLPEDLVDKQEPGGGEEQGYFLQKPLVRKVTFALDPSSWSGASSSETDTGSPKANQLERGQQLAGESFTFTAGQTAHAVMGANTSSDRSAVPPPPPPPSSSFPLFPSSSPSTPGYSSSDVSTSSAAAISERCLSWEDMNSVSRDFSHNAEAQSILWKISRETHVHTAHDHRKNSSKGSSKHYSQYQEGNERDRAMFEKGKEVEIKMVAIMI